MSNALNIDDIVLIKSIQDPFSDGNDLVTRLKQAPGRRYTIVDDGGLLKVRGRREVWVGKSNVAYMVPMTPARAEALGDKVEPAKAGK